MVDCIDRVLLIYDIRLNELKQRGVIRTNNNPVGDYAEWLVSQKLNLNLEKNSKKSYDAEDESTGETYQIKARWECGGVSGQSRQLSMLRNLEKNDFDNLVVVIFNNDFIVKEAYLIPCETVKRYARYNDYQQGYRLNAMGAVLKDDSVKDITSLL